MAKGDNGLGKLIKQQGGAMQKERMADYRVTMSTLTAAQGNQRNQQRNLSSALAGTNRSVGRSLAKLTQNAKNVQANVAKQQNRNEFLYGRGIGKAVAEQYGIARMGASQALRQARSLQGEGQDVRAAGATAIGIARAGAQAGMSAAQSALAQALQQRTVIDNNTLAQLEGQAQNTALQYNLQLKNFEKEKQITDGTLPADAKEVANSLQTGGAQLAVDAKQYWRTEQVDGQVDVSTATSDYAKSAGITDPSDPRIAVFQAVMGQLNQQQATNGKAMIGPAYQAAIQQLYGGQKGFTPQVMNSMALAAITHDTRMDFVKQMQDAQKLQSGDTVGDQTGGGGGSDNPSNYQIDKYGVAKDTSGGSHPKPTVAPMPGNHWVFTGRSWVQRPI